MAARLIEPFMTYNNSNGVPLAGGKLRFFVAGTVSTPKDTFSDDTLLVANPNPIILDAAGRAGVDVWGDGEYKLVVADSLDNDIDTFDPVTGSIFGQALNSIAEMTALLKANLTTGDQVSVSGYFAQGDDGGDDFFFDSTSTATANLYDTFATDEGGAGRWFRIVEDYVIQSAQWGLIDGADNTTIIQAMFTYAAALTQPKKIRFNEGDSIISGTGVSITSFVDGLEVDLGDHIFDVTVTDNNSAFSFGDSTNTVANPTPGNDNLDVHGGIFSQADDAVTRRFITVYDTNKPQVHDVTGTIAGNGAIMIGVAVKDFKIYLNTFVGHSSDAVNRPIWINGSSVVGYLGQVVDTSDFTLISANPTTILRGEVYGNILDNQQYGIYLQNARDVKIHDNEVTLDPSMAARCIAVNNFSPRTTIYNNRLESSVSSTGILITQASTEVKVHNNEFFGSFAGNRDIYVQYLGEAIITDNTHITDGTQKVQVDNGGFATVLRNTYKRRSRVFNTATRAIFYSSLDANDLSLGGTAVEVGGLIAMYNHFYDDGTCVLVDQNQSTTGPNFFGSEVIMVDRNTCHRRDLASHAAGQAVLAITVTDDSKPMNFTMQNNDILPFAAANNQSTPKVTGTVTTSQRAISFRKSAFNVDITSGIVAVNKLYGDRFTLAASLSGNNLLMTPRTGNGQPAIGVADLLGIMSNDTTVGNFSMQDGAASNPIMTLLDNAIPAAAIALTVTDGNINVFLSADAID